MGKANPVPSSRAGQVMNKAKMKKISQQYKLQRQKANARNNKYKSNLSEEKKETLRAKARERYRKKKKLGIIKPITERSEREKRRQRKIWKNATANYRRNIKKTSDDFDSSFLEPEVVIKEEPIDNDEDPTMSRLDHECILPCPDSYQPCFSPAIKEVFTVVKTEPMEESQQITSNCRANKRKISETADVARQISSNGRTTKPSSRKAAEKDNVLELTESKPTDEDAATSKTNSSKDSFDVYGEYIAAKLRNLDLESCTCVQKAFADILIDAEKGKFK